MRILLAHVEHSRDSAAWYRAIAAAAPPELEVRTFGVTLHPPGPRLTWRELDRLWRLRDRTLFTLYERLRRAADDCDVMLLYNGVNLHPELLPHLPTFNAYACFDDPESSADLSQPLAPAFDAVFHGNIASRFQYEHWGCKQLAWLPVFNAPGDHPPRAESAQLLARERDVAISFVGERESPWRRARLDALVAEFPEARCFGRGWSGGRADEAALADLYRRTRIGWNVHNSTGPINRRLFALPAFGALQLCDNKTGLGAIFALGEEAVGFDTIPEAIELTRHYLAHPDEARAIARRGHERFWRDYHAEAIWRRIHEQLVAWGAERRCAGGAAPALPRWTPLAPLRDAVERARPLWRRARRAAALVREGARVPRPASGPFDDRYYRGERALPYRENREMFGVNMAAERLAKEGFLDWPDMLALNWAVTALIGDARRIVEIGSGTGPFAEFAARDPRRQIHCFEHDGFARARAVELRSFPNVRYFAGVENVTGRYDALFSIEVIEHVRDLREYLDLCAQLAPRAVFTTPHREVHHGRDHVGPPTYPPHVREFTPGELLWLLRLYYASVTLYTLPDPHVPWLVPMTVATQSTPIVAECREPLAPRIAIE